MNLYKLTLIEEQYKGFPYDAMYGIIVAAETSKEAREIVNELSWTAETRWDFGDFWKDWREGQRLHNNIWLKPKYTKVQKIGIASKGVKKGMILEDVHWG